MNTSLQLLTATTDPGIWPGSATQSYLPLVLVALLAIPLIWVLWRKRMPRSVGGNRKLQITESCMVGPRQFIVVASYDDERVLVGVSPGQIQYLCKVKGQPESGDAANDKGFDQLLPKDVNL